MDGDEIVLTVIRRKVTGIPGDTYMVVNWSADLLAALEAIGDQGEHADKLFALIESIEEDACETEVDEEDEVSG